ncbi:MAG: hypothetical protein IK128_06925 [Clostridiales bacterium]|nr:hypothetical protein [Lachnospiraceae bacterium]MBR5358925.1 hypothetical protein [Clostridiales bacterium]
MNPVWSIIEGTILGFVVIYSLLGVIDKKRFPDWLSYVIGITLSVLSGLNNTFVSVIDPTVFFFGSFIFMFFVFSKDRIAKRIITFVVFIVTTVAIEITTEAMAVVMGIPPDGYDIYVELFRSYSTIFLCDAFLIEVLIYRSRKITKPVFPIMILLTIPVLMLIYTLSIVLDKGDHNGFILTRTAVTAGVINIAFVVLFIAYMRVSKRVQALRQEKELMQQNAVYDKDYYELVQKEINGSRFIRHDVVNYIEQIKTLTKKGDNESLELAVKISTELEERLKE